MLLCIVIIINIIFSLLLLTSIDNTLTFNITVILLLTGRSVISAFKHLNFQMLR